MSVQQFILFLALLISFSACQQQPKTVVNADDTQAPADTSASALLDLTLYQTKSLVVKQLSERVYQHISFLETESFGMVACNGMIVIDAGEALIFDTPANDSSTVELIRVVEQELQCQLKGIVATHFHEDCLGGLNAIEEKQLPIYLSSKTAELLQADSLPFPQAPVVFHDSISVKLGNEQVYTHYLGEGHTKDNVVGYFPAENALFGGCLVKKVGASKGYLGDANTDQWPITVQKVKSKFPLTTLVIPGHGKPGGTKLLDYTIALFSD